MTGTTGDLDLRTVQDLDDTVVIVIAPNAGQVTLESSDPLSSIQCQAVWPTSIDNTIVGSNSGEE